jgi:hypothetical protein
VGVERVVNAWWSGAVSLETSSDLRASLAHYAYDSTRQNSVLVKAGEQERSLANFFWRPWDRYRGLFLSLYGERVDRLRDRDTRMSFGVVAMLQGVRTGLQWKEEWSRSEFGTQVEEALAYQVSTILRARHASLLHGIQVRLQGEFNTTRGQNDWIELLLGRRVGRNARLELSAAWYRWSDQPQISINLNTTSPWTYANVNAVRTPGGQTATSVSAEGSLLYNSGTERVETYPFRSLGLGGLGGTVFLDNNGNGIFDTGESGVPGVRLVVGNLIAETDDYGRYSVWSLVPFEAADIQVETSSLRNPLWIPVFDCAAAPISPNDFRQIDLPLVEGVELEGRVQTRRGDAFHSSGAVPLRLIQDPGTREYKTRSFQDGEFYLLGVAPGRYRVEVDEEWLGARNLRVSGDGRRFLEVPAGAGVIDLNLELEPSG